jgi:hypothetical protein
MQILNATGLHRKSGGAQWRDLRFLPIPQELRPESPLSPCHPDRSAAQWRDLQCALRLSQILPAPSSPSLKHSNLSHPSPLVIPTPEAQWKHLLCVLRLSQSFLSTNIHPEANDKGT